MPPPPTARLEFRTWLASDLKQAAAVWADPQVMRYIGGPYSRDELVARLAREVENDATYGVQYWPVFIEGEFAGCCGLKPHDPELRLFEIGFQFLPERWGGGYASEAARAVLAYAFDVLGIQGLFAGHHPENDASRRLLMRLGFTELGTHFFARTGLQHPWWRLDAP